MSFNFHFILHLLNSFSRFLLEAALHHLPGDRSDEDVAPEGHQLGRRLSQRRLRRPELLGSASASSPRKLARHQCLRFWERMRSVALFLLGFNLNLLIRKLSCHLCGTRLCSAAVCSSSPEWPYLPLRNMTAVFLRQFCWVFFCLSFVSSCSSWLSIQLELWILFNCSISR